MLPSNNDPVSKHSCRYLIKERVVSFFDASSVRLSANMYFYNRLYVVSRQLPSLDDPDPDLDNEKIHFITKNYVSIYFF